MPDPLARPVWSWLAGRGAALSLTQAGARRLQPAYGLFAALDDDNAETLAGLGALARAHGSTALVEPEAAPSVPGTAVVSHALCWQMAADGPVAVSPAAFAIVPLSEADAGEMYALAISTRPGPWVRLTHRLGEFVGVKQDGRLVAMAGERMRPDGHAEVSGVCTHPDHRGRGYGAALLLRVAARIQARGETPFLHVYADNAGAIALYRSLGFAFRRELVMTTLRPA